MNADEAKKDPALQALTEGLLQALGPRLRSVVLYGSAARGDYHAAASDLNVILVLESLDPATLEALAPAVRRFVRKGHPVPRLFSPALIAASADSFPIELVDIRAGRAVLHGEDPFSGVAVAPDNLRLQIEREIKEKMMRARLRRGEKGTQDLKTIFARYYDQLTRAAERVDRLSVQGGETK